MLDFVQGAWSLLSREQKQALVLLAASVPLGLVSIFVGLRESHYLLVATGATSLACATISVAFVGFALISLCYALLKLFLSLPSRLIKWTMRIRKSSATATTPNGTEAADGKHLEPKDRERNQHQAGDGFDWVDLGLLFWLGVAILQIVLLKQKLG